LVHKLYNPAPYTNIEQTSNIGEFAHKKVGECMIKIEKQQGIILIMKVGTIVMVTTITPLAQGKKC